MNMQISLKRLLFLAMLSIAVITVPGISQANERGHHGERSGHHHNRDHGYYKNKYTKNGRSHKYNKHRSVKYDKHRGHKYDKHRGHRHDKHRGHEYGHRYSSNKHITSHYITKHHRKGLLFYLFNY